MKRKITYLMLLGSLAAVPFTLTTGCASNKGHETTGIYDDKTITSEVKNGLYRDPLVKGAQVTVTTFQGVVQLSGFVESQTQKDRAEEIARQTTGVQSVRNDLMVATGR